MQDKPVPQLDNANFDRLLDDIVRILTERVLTLGYENVPFSLYVASWNFVEKQRNWGSIDIVDFPVKFENVPVLLSSIGRSLVHANNVPIASYWVQKARMDTKIEGAVNSHKGFLVLGMTDDARLNSGFLAINDNNEPMGADMFYASSTSDATHVEANILYSLYDAVSAAMKGVEKGDGDDLVAQLFRRR